MPSFSGITNFLNQAFAGVTTLVALAPAYYVLRLMIDYDDTVSSTTVFTRRFYNGVKKTAVNLGLLRKTVVFDGVLKQQPYGRPSEYERSGHLFYEKKFWKEALTDFATLLGFGDRSRLLDKRLLRMYVRQKRAEDIPRPWTFLYFADHVAGLEHLLRRDLSLADVHEIRMVKKYFRWARVAAMIPPFSSLAGFL
jgi:hypothetical protein